MKKIIFCVLFLFLSVVYTEKLYVKSKYAKLREHPHKKRTIKKVKRGSELIKIKKVRNWIRVKYQGKKLWVYKAKVSRKKPRIENTILFAKLTEEDLRFGSDVRGFDSSSKETMTKSEMFMEYSKSFICTDKEEFSSSNALVKITSNILETFQEKGKIGPYANLGDPSDFE